MEDFHQDGRSLDFLLSAVGRYTRIRYWICGINWNRRYQENVGCGGIYRRRHGDGVDTWILLRSTAVLNAAVEVFRNLPVKEALFLPSAAMRAVSG